MAKLERFIDKQGKTDAFRTAFKEVNGDEWVNARDSAASITASLERLLTQNYISRNGDTYQYYNTELKDDTFAQLKKNVKITKERIPAATQLFTPDWIVRDMVENSLGRLWLEGHPNAELHDDWKYYLDEAEQEPGVDAQLAKLREEYTTIKPEEIKVIEIPLPKLIQNQAA